MVIGFNIIFMTMGFRLSQYASDAYEKYCRYYQIEQTQYVAQSATNIALSGIYIAQLLNPGSKWAAPTGTVTLPNTFANGGASFTVAVDSTISIKHDTVQVSINATYAGIKATTVVDFARSSFTQYAMYNVNENGIYWITGDTCEGALHTQDFLYVSGNPYFKGEVTTGKGLSKLNGSADHPTFAGGYHTGVNQPLPTDVTDVKALGRATGATGGKDWVHTGTYPTPSKVELLFKNTGEIYATVTPQTGSSSYGTPVTTKYNNIAALAPNGVVLVENMEVRIKGVVSGNVTIGSVGTNSCVFIDSSVVYGNAGGVTPPKNADGTVNSACTATLGIVADNDVMITDNADNGNNVTIDAAIFSLKGGFGAEHYDTRSIDGTIKLVGAVQAYDRNPVGTFSGGSIIHGFQKNYDYDSRLQDSPPLGYPQTTNFAVKNWFEQITKYPDIFGFLNEP
jgi:hypothetical protein